MVHGVSQISIFGNMAVAAVSFKFVVCVFYAHGGGSVACFLFLK